MVDDFIPMSAGSDMNFTSKRIIVCIPAYNEEKTIGDIVRRAKKYATEVVVYDDGSTDNTKQFAEIAGASTVIRNPQNKGYGVAIRALFQAAREKNADVLVTIDSDGQHNPDQIPNLIEPILSDGFDLVIGSRFLNRHDSKKIPVYRSIGIKTITRVTQYASYSNITDAQSGLRAYGRQALSRINLFEEGMAVSAEILLRAKEKNLLVKEIPVIISYDDKTNKTSTHNPVSHGIGVLYSIVQFISLRHPLAFYGLPGLGLLIVSAFVLNNALELFSRTGFVSTNMILVSVGAAVVGVVLLATGAILYTLIALFKGKLREDA
jgi:glycosyltransferase involved in cell wall biosynthesis